MPAPYPNLALRPQRLLRRLAPALAALATVGLSIPASAAAASTFFIRGGGNGHGIGLSQYGAYGYALHGQDYRFILAHYYQGTQLGTADPSRTVRVLLATGAASFTHATRAGSTQLDPASTYQVQASGASLLIKNAGGKTVGRSGAPLTVTGPGDVVDPALGAYRGALVFRPDGAGGVETVNALGLDDYVRGVISAEMPSSWSAQALEAQAVAARTYAITTSVGAADFDLYPDTRSQMYTGVSAETPATDAAVAATSGQIVTFNGAPAVTYFFASSGGHTENIQDVWQGSTPEPWLTGVPDPYDGAGGDPYHQWTRQLSLPAAKAKLSGLVKGNLIGIQVTKHGASPRILTASVVGSRGRTSVSGTHLQSIFGLLTTYAAFTTISTVTAARSQVPTLKGNVFPAPRNAKLSVQSRSGRGWHTLEQAPIGAGGTYSVRLLTPGTYRVLYSGLPGPAVSASFPTLSARPAHIAPRAQVARLPALSARFPTPPRH
jgi:stage II sporulation protein D